MTTATEPRRAPASASAREYLRGGMPTVYRERATGSDDDPFAMRFVAGLEGVLDPIVSMLDNLPAHLDMDIAPSEVVALVGQWLGLDLEAALNPATQRQVVREAAAITRARGTRTGLAHVLELAFGHLDLEVRDGGRATFGTDPSAPAPAGDSAFTVLCPAHATAAERAAIRRVVAELKPAHVGFELRIAEGGGA